MLNIEQVKAELLKHDYKYIKTLGHGSYSTVFLCESLKYNDEFAVKCVFREKLKEYEYNALTHLIHPNIIKLYEVIEEKDKQYLVMDYCENDTLKERGKLDYTEFRYYSRQILEALYYCHSKMIAHRDIKPENVFIDKYNRVKLADFGFAKQFDNDIISNERVGSVMYCSPEIINGQSLFNPFEADVYALGITFFYMATGNTPFASSSIDHLKRLIKFGQIDFTQYHIKSEVQKMIMKMTSHNPKLRPTIDNILKLPLYQQINLNESCSNQPLHQSSPKLCRPVAFCLSDSASIKKKKTLITRKSCYQKFEMHPTFFKDNW